MPAPRTRREFLGDVAKGALLASVGPGLAAELGARLAFADAGPAPLSFGALEPLVRVMQETSVDRLLPLLVERLRTGTEVRTLVAAAALANARTFGGEDYVGFHTMMALAPAYRMALESPEKSRALPVLKVLYRNTERIQQFGGRASEVLHQVEPAALPEGRPGGEVLRDAVRAKDVGGADRAFAALSLGKPEQALDPLLVAVDDDLDVHRVVMPYRAWDLLEVTGREHAQTLLRQSVHFCVKAEMQGGSRSAQAVRALLPKVLERHHLAGKEPGSLPADDDWVDRTSRALFEATAEDAAEVAGAALAEGRAPAALGEAISLAANQLLLRDAGRTAKEERPDKPVGSVHGDSIGLHASDSANAWKNLARLGNAQTTFSCLILGAYQVARDRVARGGDFLHWNAYPLPEDLRLVTSTEPEALLAEADAAVREKNQARASAVVHRYDELGHPARRVFDVLLKYATTEDGALHAEKYYRTACEEFAAGRPAFRRRHLVALARVTASEFGRRAAGIDEASRLLGV